MGSLAALSWKYGYAIPYTYTMYDFLKSGVQTKAAVPDVNIHVMAAAFFAVCTIAAYVLYVTKKEKG